MAVFVFLFEFVHKTKNNKREVDSVFAYRYSAEVK